MSELSDIGKNLLDTAVSGFKLALENAADDAKEALQAGLQASGELAKDFAAGYLSVAQLGDFLRKVELTVESKIARIAREQSRAYVRNVLGLLIGGATNLLGSMTKLVK